MYRLVAALLVLCACGLPPDTEEEVGVSRAELATLYKMNVGDGTVPYDRYLTYDAASSEYRLHYNYDDALAGRAFQPNTTDTAYHGCGRKAAQNALRWFGIEMSQTDVMQYVPGHGVPFSSNIATWPEELRSGLQHILDAKAKKPYVAIRSDHQTKDDIKSALARGYPVIALVQNGGHWVVVSSRSSSGNWRVHDNWSSEVWSSPELDLQFHGLPQWFAMLDGVTSYEEGTIITFAPKAPPSTALCPTGQRCCEHRADGSCLICRSSSMACN